MNKAAFFAALIIGLNGFVLETTAAAMQSGNETETDRKEAEQISSLEEIPDNQDFEKVETDEAETAVSAKNDGDEEGKPETDSEENGDVSDSEPKDEDLNVEDVVNGGEDKEAENESPGESNAGGGELPKDETEGNSGESVAGPEDDSGSNKNNLSPEDVVNGEKDKTEADGAKVPENELDADKEEYGTEILEEDTDAVGDIQMDFLQVPQETTVVIDPWEIDGKGQIYSERFVIENIGTSAGTLVLYDFALSSRGQEEVVVSTDKDRIHSGWEKLVYLEMIFENEDRMLLGQEDSEYDIRLEPGDELAFWFAGEVNENASQPWQDSDVAIAIKYLWKAEEMELVKGGEKEKDKDGKPVTDIENEGDSSKDMTADTITGKDEKEESGIGKEEDKGGKPAADAEIDKDDSGDVSTDMNTGKDDKEESGTGQEENKDGTPAEDTEGDKDDSGDTSADMNDGEADKEESGTGQEEDKDGTSAEDTEGDKDDSGDTSADMNDGKADKEESGAGQEEDKGGNPTENIEIDKGDSGDVSADMDTDKDKGGNEEFGIGQGEDKDEQVTSDIEKDN